MFENWNKFVTETQKRIKAEKPRGNPQTGKELQNRRKARHDSTTGKGVSGPAEQQHAG